MWTNIEFDDSKMCWIIDQPIRQRNPGAHDHDVYSPPGESGFDVLQVHSLCQLDVGSLDLGFQTS